MNGRIYAPQLGRMLSPDPVTQAPDNGQNYNRYSYAFNNPLKYVDPTGYSTAKFDDTGPNPSAGGLSSTNSAHGTTHTGIDDGVDVGSDVSEVLKLWISRRGCGVMPRACLLLDSSPTNQSGDSEGLTLGGYTTPADIVEVVENPALNIADAALDDGRLDLWEANQIWAMNIDPSFSVVVDASKLTVRLSSTGPLSNGEWIGVVVGAADWLVHGSVQLVEANGSYTIKSEQYDFDQKPGRHLRNFETAIGQLLAGEGTPYLIVFDGVPGIYKPPQIDRRDN